MLRSVRATTYATPLREGGSLPGLVEADDDGMYVVKFRGAGQGTPALVAEVVVGQLGRYLGIRVPEIVLVDVDPAIAPHEPDQEVQDLLRASSGLNLGMDFLPGSIGYSGIGWQPPTADAITIVWLDALTANVDRSWRNPNLLVWHRTLWAIDHGAALVFQHSWPAIDTWASRGYGLSDHALAPVIGAADPALLRDADAHLARRITTDVLEQTLAAVPDEWLLAMPSAASGEHAASWWRDRYVAYLSARLGGDRAWWTQDPQ